MDLEEFIPDSRPDFDIGLKLEPELGLESEPIQNSGKCQYDRCRRLALYFWPGETPTLCRTHKKREMKRILKPKITCEHAGCQAPAIYGYKFKSVPAIPVRCWTHKDREMINLSTVCDFETCIKKSKFNLKSGARYCTTHKYVTL